MTCEDLALIRDSARRHLADRFPLEATRALLDAPADSLDREGWKSLADHGWLGMAIPEGFGGLGLSPIELCLVCEEMGRALVPLPFTATAAMLPFALLRYGSEVQKQAWLPRIAAGEFAATLGSADTPAGDPGLSFRDGKISGAKSQLPDGLAADVALLMAREDDGDTLLLVDLRHAGVERNIVDSIDPTRPLARLLLDDVPAERIGAAGAGRSVMDRVLADAVVPLAYEQIGGAARCLETSTSYARERFAFGRAIGSFQAIKHKLADVFAKVEIARLACEQAANSLARGAPDLEICAAAARVAACDAYWVAAKENIQVHGGIGFTWEMDCHLFYRRSKLLGVTCGPAFVWKDRLARQLLETEIGV